MTEKKFIDPDPNWLPKLQDAISTAVVSAPHGIDRFDAVNAREVIELYRAEDCLYFGQPVTIRVVIEPREIRVPYDDDRPIGAPIHDMPFDDGEGFKHFQD
jgi:hypothetical protein